MNIIDRLLAERRSDAPVRDLLLGTFWTVVVLDTVPPHGGLASTLRPDAHGPGPIPKAGHLPKESGWALTEWLRSSNPMKASVGMAALNAFLDVDQTSGTEINAREILLERGTGKRIAVVGHFPFVDRLREAAAQCWVIEQRPRPGDLSADRAPDVLPQADVVALTGTSLINHTFDDLIRLCRSDAFVLILGPSAPLTPVLFEAGVDAVSGTLVTDPEQVVTSVAQGATFRQIKQAGGVHLLTIIRE